MKEINYIITTFVVNERDLPFFLEHGFCESAGEWPYAIGAGQAVVTRVQTAQLPVCSTPSMAVGDLDPRQTKAAHPFYGICRRPDISNLRICEEVLLVCDGKELLECPAHAYRPCVPFSLDGAVGGMHVLYAEALARAGRFCRQWASIQGVMARQSRAA